MKDPYILLLILSTVLVSGCILPEPAAPECDEGATRCLDEVVQECISGKWAATGKCPAVPSVEITDLKSDPLTYEGETFRVEGKVAEIKDGKARIESDGESVWVECISGDCAYILGKTADIKTTPAYEKTYRITYTLPRSNRYLADRYQLNYESFPVSSEGAITSKECESLADIGTYYVENGVSPSNKTQMSLSHIGFYEVGKKSEQVYDRFMQTLCDPDDAYVRNAFTEESENMWCSKIRGGSYCYISYSIDSTRPQWDWLADPSDPKESTDMEAHQKVSQVCNVYDGQLISTIELNLLKNSFGFKPTICKTRIYPEDNKLKTTQYCLSQGGEVEDKICTVIDKQEIEECTNDNNEVSGYYCIERSKCLGEGGAFEMEGGEFYCTDMTGITMTDIFNSYSDSCLIGSDRAICNLKDYIIDEVIVTEYILKETE